MAGCYQVMRVALAAAQGVGAGTVLGYPAQGFAVAEVTERARLKAGSLPRWAGRVLAKAGADSGS